MKSKFLVFIILAAVWIPGSPKSSDDDNDDESDSDGGSTQQIVFTPIKTSKLGGLLNPLFTRGSNAKTRTFQGPAQHFLVSIPQSQANSPPTRTTIQKIQVTSQPFVFPQQSVRSPAVPQQFSQPIQTFNPANRQPFAQPIGQQFAQPFGQPFGQPVGSQFRQPFGQQFGQPFGQSFGAPFFGNQFPNGATQTQFQPVQRPPFNVFPGGGSFNQGMRPVSNSVASSADDSDDSSSDDSSGEEDADDDEDEEEEESDSGTGGGSSGVAAGDESGGEGGQELPQNQGNRNCRGRGKGRGKNRNCQQRKNKPKRKKNKNKRLRQQQRQQQFRNNFQSFGGRFPQRGFGGRGGGGRRG